MIQLTEKDVKKIQKEASKLLLHTVGYDYVGDAQLRSILECVCNLVIYTKMDEALGIQINGQCPTNREA